MSHYCGCPRCGEKSLEKLKTYSHCANCLYFEDYWTSPESDVTAAQKALREFSDEISKANPKCDVIEIEPENQTKKMKGA